MNAAGLIEELEGFDANVAGRAEALRMAQAAMRFAIELMETVADETEDAQARTCLVDQLKAKVEATQGFNIGLWIELLRIRGEA